MKESESSVENHYDAIADAWETFTRAPWKAELLWPTTRSLLPDVMGKRVLDVGCGDGAYSKRLADRGADVTGIDLSREMVEVARRKHGGDVEFRQADITDSLAFADDEQFDLVLCQHVFSHLPDLDGPIAEFARILASGGSLVVSTHNPVHDFLVVWEGEYPETSAIDGTELNPVVDPDPERPTYHDTERFEIHWNGPESSNPGTYYRRSVSELLQSLLDAGFSLDELVEPDLRDVWAEGDPNVPPELRRRPPRSICYRATR